MPCGHVPLWANTPAAMDREVKTKLSRVASAINELAFRVLERPSINRESVCGKRSISFFPQTIDALAIVDAVALDPIARAEASYAHLTSCSIFLSQVSRMEP